MFHVHMFHVRMFYVRMFYVRTCMLRIFLQFSKAGQIRLEKKWAAHQGACIQCRASPNGTEILTCGEDGTVKIWSKSGLLRTTLASLGQAIYAVAWSPDGTNVVMSQATKIQTKSIQPSARSEIWNAHTALITGSPTHSRMVQP